MWKYGKIVSNCGAAGAASAKKNEEIAAPQALPGAKTRECIFNIIYMGGRDSTGSRSKISGRDSTGGRSKKCGAFTRSGDPYGRWELREELSFQKHDESTPIASGSKWSQLRRQQRMTSARKQYEFCECRLFTALQAPRGGKSNNAAKRLKNARHGNETQRSNMRLIDNGRATLRFPHGHIFGAALEWARSGRLHLVHLMGELVHSLRGGGCDVRGKGPPGREELLRGDFFCKKGARGTAVGPLCLPLPIIPGPK
eukprot:gene17684-biopygen5363